MIAQRGLSAAEWFDRAAQDYVDGHQACPWCGQRHCLFRRHRGARLEYHCASCEFSTCADHNSGKHYWFPGAAEEDKVTES